MTNSYDNILKAYDTDLGIEAVKDIFSEEDISIDEDTMQDIISNCEIIKGNC